MAINAAQSYPATSAYYSTYRRYPQQQRRQRLFSSRRLAWISIILSFISFDLNGLALFSVIQPPTRWYADLLLIYGPTNVLPAAMLALGGPLALLGLCTAGATVRRKRVSFAALVGFALNAISLAVPILFATAFYVFARGLL